MKKMIAGFMVVLLAILFSNFAMGAYDSVFQFTLQSEGARLIGTPYGVQEIWSFEIQILIVTTPGLVAQDIDIRFNLSDWVFVVSTFPDVEGRIMKIVGVTESNPLTNTSFAVAEIDIREHVGSVRMIFQKAWINGGPGEVGGKDVLSLHQTENFLFYRGYVLGDVNGNGIIQSDDAVMILDSIVTGHQLSPLSWQAAEVSGLGGVTTRDAMLILQYAAGIITEFPYYDGKGAPAKNPLSFDDMVEELRASEEIDGDTIDLLVQARNHEQGRLKKKLPTTWGGIKS